MYEVKIQIQRMMEKSGRKTMQKESANLWRVQ